MCKLCDKTDQWIEYEEFRDDHNNNKEDKFK